MHPITPIIRTGAYSILRDVARAALETARLGIVRGPVGIGKTFALRQIADELSQGDDQVFLIEAPSDKSKAVRRFYQSALYDLGAYGHGGADPFDVFTGYMLRSYPFRRAGQRKRILLIVDECQRLAPNILETLRHAYDAGQLARNSPIPWGDIPARPFLGFSQIQIDAIEEIAEDWLWSLFNDG